jgi:DNA polymerase-1
LNKEEEKAMKELLKEIGASRAYSYLTKTDDKELVGKEAALLSKKLATIVTNIDEVKALNIDDLKLNINKAGMEKKFKELEFKSLLNKAV